MSDSTTLNYRALLFDILREGRTISPRGLEVKELEEAQFIVDPYHPFLKFEDRDYDVNYFKKEMRWKLGANKYDTSIQKHAKLWKDMINPDGTYNSNYGQYWFGDQGGIWSVITELIRDPDSRKAVIPMLNMEHMSPHVVDTVCTECVGFRLRKLCEGSDYLSLNMSVHMRSSDVIYGLSTDLPTFAFLYRLVHAILNGTSDYGISFDKIIMTCMSSHLYAKHYDLAEKILVSNYIDVKMPECSCHDAIKIIASRGRENVLMKSGELGVWLCDYLTTNTLP